MNAQSGWSFRHIVVCNTAFLGDAVLTLPLLQVLRRAFPTARLEFVVRKGLEMLFEAQPDLDLVIAFDKHKSQRGLAALWHFGHTLHSPDLFVAAQGSIRTALLGFFSGARVRVGHAGGIMQRLCHTHTVDRCFGKLDEIERLIELARPFCPAELMNDKALHWPRLTLPASTQVLAKQRLGALGKHTGPTIGVHPGSVWPTKRWPAAHYAALVRLAARAGVRVILFAGPGEEAIAHEVRHLSGLTDPARLTLWTDLPLPVLAAVLGHLDAYVCNDSGPMHLAWVQGTPVTALFGPTTRSLGFFPRGETASVCEVPLDCRPCGLHGSRACPKGHHHCMTQLEPATVWAEVARKLRGYPQRRQA